MLLEKQVCAKEYGEKLAALGVECESYFSWNKINGQWIPFKPITNYSKALIPAYTVAELFNMAQAWRDCSMCEIVLADVDADYMAEFVGDLIKNGQLTAEEINA